MTPQKPHILVTHPDPEFVEVVVESVEALGFHATGARSLEDALEEAAARDVSLLLAGFGGVGQGRWADLEKLREAVTPAPIGLFTANGLSPEEAAQRGVSFTLRMPFDVPDLALRLSEHVPSGPVSRQRRAAVEAYFQALTDRNWKALGLLCTDDVRYHLPGQDPSFAREVKGRAAFERFSEETFAKFPGARFDVDAVLSLPQESAVARYSGSWLSEPARRVSTNGSVVFRFDGAKIREIGVRLSVRRLAEQLQPRGR